MLCTLAQLKVFLGIGSVDTSYDAQLTPLIEQVSTRLALAAGRNCNGMACLEKTSIIEYFDIPTIRMAVLYLSAYPVISVSEIIEAYYGQFTDAPALLENQDYQMHYPSGALYRILRWLPGRQTVRATYSGGYTFAPTWISGASYAIGDVAAYMGLVYACIKATTGTTLPSTDTTDWAVQTGETPLPADLNQAAIMQAAFWHQRRGTLTMDNASVQGGSVAYTPVDLLPEVKAIAGNYARMIGS
jgi:hypothetical protein